MPAEFQNAVDYTIIGHWNNFCFIDDIIIVSTESESDNFTMWQNVRKKLNNYKLRINLLKCHFVKSDNACPEFKFTQ